MSHIDDCLKLIDTYIGTEGAHPLTIQARAELSRLRLIDAVFCDKPDDRLYHAADQTWWKRVNGELVSAEEPESVARLRERCGALEKLNEDLRTNACEWADCAIELAPTKGDREALSMCFTRERVAFLRRLEALTATQEKG